MATDWARADLRAFRALRSFQARSTARTWLLGIARHTCVGHLRSIARSRRLIARIATIQPSTDRNDVDIGARLVAEQLLNRLTATQREALTLTQMLGLSYDDTASLLELPIGTIRSRVARARSRLLAEVQQSLAA